MDRYENQYIWINSRRIGVIGFNEPGDEGLYITDATALSRSLTGEAYQRKFGGDFFQYWPAKGGVPNDTLEQMMAYAGLNGQGTADTIPLGREKGQLLMGGSPGHLCGEVAMYTLQEPMQPQQRDALIQSVRRAMPGGVLQM